MSGINNRSLDDPLMDALDHALGRPDHPLREDNPRNFFGVEEDGEDAERMKADPHWKFARNFAGTAGFLVSRYGRERLHEYLQANWTPPKKYEVKWQGLTSVVPAKSAGAAKYDVWARCDFTDLSFGQFLKECRARVAQSS